jgi:hypothetical protein
MVIPSDKADDSYEFGSEPLVEFAAQPAQG